MHGRDLTSSVYISFALLFVWSETVRQLYSYSLTPRQYICRDHHMAQTSLNAASYVGTDAPSLHAAYVVSVCESIYIYLCLFRYVQ